MAEGTPNGDEHIVWKRMGGGALAHLPRALDERLQASDISSAADNVVIFDFDRVRVITSVAVRAWVYGLRALRASYYGFINCHPTLMTQFSMVRNFSGSGEVISLYAPFLCPTCGSFEVLVDLRIAGNLQTFIDGAPRPCPKCSAESEFDDVPEIFFAYVSAHPEPRPPPLAQQIIAGDSAPSAHKLQVEKSVRGELSIIRLAGMLEQRVRLHRLVGAETGSVLLDLADLAGVSANVSLDEIISETSLDVRIADLPATVFGSLTERQRRALDQRVVSVLVAGTCARCHAPQLARRAEPALELSAKTVCQRCGGSVVADDASAVALPPTLLTAQVPSGVLEWFALRSEGVSSDLTGRPLFAGRYEIVRTIGRGGMGEVCLARQHGPAGFEKEVVLKRVAWDGGQRAPALFTASLLREGRIAARISHPNVVQIFDLGCEGDTYFVVMEYVPGSNLRALLQQARLQGSVIPVEIVCRIGADVCAALNAAQQCVDEKGTRLEVVHRDISPENIMISRDGIVKVADFGLAVLSSDGLLDEKSASTGKPRYLAPEQVGGATKLDTRVDLFALGVVLYEAAAGKHPFAQENEWLSLQAIERAEVAPLRDVRSDCPAELEAVLARALARNADDRFAQPASMQQELERIILSLGRSATPSTLATWAEPLVNAGSIAANEETMVGE